MPHEHNSSDRLNDVRRTLDIDLVADFTCPWSWLGMAQLTRALGNLSGDVETRLRWHPFRMASAAANAAPRSFHDYLAERLPSGISVPFAEKSLTEAGRELGIEFHFEKLGALPSTSEAHRLVQLAVNEGRHANVAAAIFRAYFERGADIGDVDGARRLGARGRARRQDAPGISAIRAMAMRALVGSEERLRGFGVRTVPNLLFGGRVLGARHRERRHLRARARPGAVSVGRRRRRKQAADAALIRAVRAVLAAACEARYLTAACRRPISRPISRPSSASRDCSRAPRCASARQTLFHGHVDAEHAGAADAAPSRCPRS